MKSREWNGWSFAFHVKIVAKILGHSSSRWSPEHDKHLWTYLQDAKQEKTFASVPRLTNSGARWRTLWSKVSLSTEGSWKGTSCAKTVELIIYCWLICQFSSGGVFTKRLVVRKPSRGIKLTKRPDNKHLLLYIRHLNVDSESTYKCWTPPPRWQCPWSCAGIFLVLPHFLPHFLRTV